MHLHGATSKFSTPTELKQQLIESLGEHVPDESAIDSFNVGYLLKPSQSKQWITCSQDLQAMYNQSSEGETISLWCDQRLPVVEESCGTKRSTDNDSVKPPVKRSKATTSNFTQREDEIEEISTELEEKHGDQYSFPQYKLWARLIKCGQHADKDNPPNVPMITGSYSRGRKKDSGMGEAIAGAAVAIVKALKGSASQSEDEINTNSTGISPGQKVLLSGEYLKQLGMIQKLKDDGVLTISEFEAQKERILSNLQAIN